MRQKEEKQKHKSFFYTFEKLQKTKIMIPLQRTVIIF